MADRIVKHRRGLGRVVVDLQDGSIRVRDKTPGGLHLRFARPISQVCGKCLIRSINKIRNARDGHTTHICLCRRRIYRAVEDEIDDACWEIGVAADVVDTHVEGAGEVRD